MQRNSLSAILLVLAAGLLWGTVGPAEILAHSPAGPVAIGGARILSGGLVLTVIVLARDPGAFRALPRAAWPALLAASAATATFQGTFLTSAARSGAAVATAITFGIAPVSTGLCERIMLGTRLPRRWIAGTACAIAGCVLISAPSGAGSAGGASGDIYGIACGVVAGGCFGVYTVSAKRLIHGNVNMQAAVPVTLLLGGAVLAPWTLSELPELAAPRSLDLIAWLGPATVALAYWLYVAGLRGLTAATAGTLSLAEPLVATALGVGILHERLSLPIATGTLLLLGGLAIVSISWPSVGARRRRWRPGWMSPTVGVRMAGGETQPENEEVADPVHGEQADDAARWWRAYQLAENDQADELRRLAAAGDDHARRQLAGWLSDRARLEEAIEVIRPLADAGDDVAELWLARWLADRGRLDELRERAGTGGHHAARELARLLADRDLLEELRDRVSASGSHYALRELARRLIERDLHEELRELVEAADADTRPLILDAAGGASSAWMNSLRVLADFGHKASRMHLARTLARGGRLEELRQRAGHGDEYARHWLETRTRSG